MTTIEAADKVRAQRIEGIRFWWSGYQEPGKGKQGGVGVFEGCEVGEIRLGDKKSGSTSHDPAVQQRSKAVSKTG
jgi:hypothetical protein